MSTLSQDDVDSLNEIAAKCNPAELRDLSEFFQARSVGDKYESNGEPDNAETWRDRASNILEAMAVEKAEIEPVEVNMSKADESGDEAQQQ